MNNKDFNRLVKPVNMLIGYASSATSLTEKNINIEGWQRRLVELAGALAKAWDEVSKSDDSTDEKT